MSRINDVFSKTRGEGRLAFIPFITAGFPDEKSSKELIKGLSDKGVDLIEIGIPFSDPVADGPIIQASSNIALSNGMNISNAFNLVENLSDEISCPIVFMTYYNPVYKYGLERFAVDCKKFGIDGIIIPDLPLEEANEWITSARRSNLDTIFMVAPTSPEERIKLIAENTLGFLYCVSLKGVTGAQQEISRSTLDFILKVRNLTSKLIAVGFGISSASQVRQLKGYADGVIIGSRLMQMMLDASDPKRGVAEILGFVDNVLTESEIRY
ncbi:MAG: tryptophan synthase subunit alpha [Actinobacteria bacterium]|nr:tryptophan synthase subunit alpha [Actinomycetota bacterium]